MGVLSPCRCGRGHGAPLCGEHHHECFSQWPSKVSLRHPARNPAQSGAGSDPAGYRLCGSRIVGTPERWIGSRYFSARRCRSDCTIRTRWRPGLPAHGSRHRIHRNWRYGGEAHRLPRIGLVRAGVVATTGALLGAVRRPRQHLAASRPAVTMS